MRFFRITQTGPSFSTMEQGEMLGCSGFELYGTILHEGYEHLDTFFHQPKSIEQGALGPWVSPSVPDIKKELTRCRNSLCGSSGLAVNTKGLGGYGPGIHIRHTKENQDIRGASPAQDYWLEKSMDDDAIAAAHPFQLQSPIQMYDEKAHYSGSRLHVKLAERVAKAKA